MTSDEAVIGHTGVLVIGTRAASGPGEVLVRVRGGTETYLAWCDERLPAGATVLVTSARGARQVDVIAWADPLDVLDQLADDAG
ncbi:NfeD family protein [Streptomyces sp. NPDC059740]|uniref:NfeD family protein n=1 Tax=Streptomyces sp. NPDC059740 TaxID=3346926 RepID=UPI00365A86B1